MKAICQGEICFVNFKEFEKKDTKEKVAYFKNTMKDMGSSQFVSFNTEVSLFEQGDFVRVEGSLSFSIYQGKVYITSSADKIVKLNLSEDVGFSSSSPVDDKVISLAPGGKKN